MIKIIELSKDNFDDFHQLLLQRGEAPRNYYCWKYLEQINNKFPTGFLAYLNDEPVGCIGNINRIYIDEFGVEHPTTWFADWFVNNGARGRGVGLALMKEIYGLSAYAFGIPGPQKAQEIATKSGYNQQYYFYEFVIPCSPFLYGFRLYKSGVIKNFLRGVRHLLKSGILSLSMDIHIEEITDFSVIDNVPMKNRLKVDNIYFNWLNKMPTKMESKRKWYKVSNSGNWVILFVENDNLNKKRGRLLIDNFIDNEKRISFLKLSRKKLSQMGVTFIQLYTHSDLCFSINKSYIKSIPQFSSFKITEDFSISFADVESRWCDFKMK